MNQDFLLLAGSAIVAWLIGIDLGGRIVGEQLSKPLNDLATGLAELHTVHVDAKEKQAAHEAALAAYNKAKGSLSEKLEGHIAKLRSEYSI